MEEESILIRRTLAGDEEAFTRLYERYCGPVKYYVRRLCGSAETTDDVLQTVWMKVLRGIRKLRRLDAFRVWLYRIARNEALQQLRRKDSWVHLNESDAVGELEDEADGPFTVVDAKRLHAALGRLKPPHREVLVLRFMEDLTYEQIAAIVGCAVGTVRSRIHYARRALRRVLKESCND